VKRHGQPANFGEKVEAFQDGLGPWLKPLWDFKPYGKSGKLLSETVAPLGEVADELAFELGRKPKLDSLWVNLLKGGGHHSAHIHPHSIISGTFYVEVPPGAGAIRFEDPRLGLMMAAPQRRPDAEGSRGFVSVAPTAGQLLLWESWLRHEVLPGTAKAERLSISFNVA